jgi:hypothetical protein
VGAAVPQVSVVGGADGEGDWVTFSLDLVVGIIAGIVCFLLGMLFENTRLMDK